MGKLCPAFLIKKRDTFCARRGGVWLCRAPLRSGSSRSLPRYAGLLNFCSCTQDKFAAPIKIVPPSLAALARGRRDTRIAHKTCTHDTRLRLGQGKAWTAKSAPPIFGALGPLYCRAVRLSNN